MIRLFGDSIFRGSAVTMRPDLRDETEASKIPLWPLRSPASVMNLVLGEEAVSLAGRLRLPDGVKESLRDLHSAFDSGAVGPDDVLIMLDVGRHGADPDAHEGKWRRLRRAATEARPTRLLICEGFDNGAGGKLAYQYDAVFGGRSINQAIGDAALEPQPTFVGHTEFVPLSQQIASYHRWLDDRFGVGAYRPDGIHLNVWGQFRLCGALLGAVFPRTTFDLDGLFAVLASLDPHLELHGEALRAAVEAAIHPAA